MRRHTEVLVWLSLGLLWAWVRSVPAQGIPRPELFVHGFVYDSIAHKPLPGAAVQFVPVDSAARVATAAATADSSGHFELRLRTGVQYLAGFYHAVVDTMGIELRPRLIAIDDTVGTITLAVPSAATIERAICGGRQATPRDSAVGGGLLVGHVHNEDESARAGGEVTITWHTPHVGRDWIGLEDRQLTAFTNSRGFFVACGAPSDSPIAVFAVAGSDSVSIANLLIASVGIRHVSLYLQAPAPDKRTMLTGKIVDGSGKAIPTATVSVVGGDRETKVGPDGRYLLDSLRGGTQTVRVRSVGYSPIDTSIRLTSIASTMLNLTLEKAIVLATVTTTANAASQASAQFRANERSSHGGFFVTPPHPKNYESGFRVFQLIGGIPGVGAHGFVGLIYVDGKRWRGSSDELNYDIQPGDIVGIEVYTRPLTIPGKYHTSSPVLVVWTKNYKSTP